MSSPALDVARPHPRVRATRPRARLPRAAFLRRLASPLVLLMLWQVASSTGLLSEQALASPWTIGHTGLALARDGTLGTAMRVSLERAALGFALGAVAGIGLALVAGLSRMAENVLDPPLQMLRALPLFGLIPLFILWFGIGETPKVAIVALGVFFPLYLNTFSGVRGVDGKLAELAQVVRLSRLELIRHIVLPGALPQILVGLRQSLGIAWLVLIVAEQINADAGLGHMINDAREFLRTDVIVLGLLIYCVLGLFTDGLVRLVERRALTWRQEFPN
ncbi:MAG: sulfonate transport system permease protein [Streptosporangiaceae bacterium]|nr:binding-protein-dependent transport system inner rane component [Streptosporangiaceae bacterium]MDX6434935.1 sulfonate transport system permease protein [Streptosporangiaceae bacterium]